MPSNILITGAAGYIGGSIIADFLASDDPLFERNQITAAVRSEEQAKALSRLGIHVVRLDLNDENAVIESLLQLRINIVIHCASAIDPTSAIYLIDGLSKQKEVSGEGAYFIHTSGLSAFYEKTGWPQGTFKDTDAVFDVEKRLADSFPIRKTDVTVIEHAKARGVTSFIVVPSLVYGKGSGEWNQLSVVLPVIVQASISQKAVSKFPENTKVSGVHISDMTALYRLITESILQKKAIPSGTEGYYFGLGHDLHMWEVLDRLAAALKSRGLVTDSQTRIWASDEAAADALGVPAPFVQPLWNSGDDMIAERPRSIGWAPKWTEELFLQSIDDEVQAVVELGKAKSGLIDSLFEANKK